MVLTSPMNSGDFQGFSDVEIWKLQNRGRLAIFQAIFWATPVTTRSSLGMNLFSTFLTTFWLLNHSIWLRNEEVTKF
ncbi:hypothetical protein DVH24_032351 [Malus domestica]|uniref:Uncharacterized protein n=1 Tax=Malus domestica TaxID=3750 RepID=A0A498J725_MALDO|nr:hypothetical protein DVH24_032351 [Malus domestica]